MPFLIYEIFNNNNFFAPGGVWLLLIPNNKVFWENRYKFDNNHKFWIKFMSNDCKKPKEIIFKFNKA